MHVTSIEMVPEISVEDKGAAKTKIQWLINKPLAKTFLMRRFRIEGGGYTPLHSHDHEHEVYVLKGRGVVSDGKRSYLLKPGSVVFVPPREMHQFKNRGRGELVLLCLIPA